MKIRVGDVRPNPFRGLDRYPINQEKVEQLKESIRTTGFWDNLVARVNKEREVELAYGHHRREALLQELGEGAEIRLIIRDLDDEAMLRIMARENMEEWGTSAVIEQETVRAVVLAYAEGKVALEKPGTANPKQIRYAPSFSPGDAQARACADYPYTADGVARFIGWVTSGGRASGKVVAALNALALEEEGTLDREDFAGLGTKQAEALVKTTRAEKVRQKNLVRRDNPKISEEKAVKEAERRSREIGKEISRKLKSGEAGYRQTPETARKVAEEKSYSPKGGLPDPSGLTKTVGGILERFLRSEEEFTLKVESLIKHKDQLEPHEQRRLFDALTVVSNRALNLLDRLGFQADEQDNGDIIDVGVVQ